MSFSPDLRILRNGKMYSTISHPKMSESTENTADTSAPPNVEHMEEPNNGILHELIEQRIKYQAKANLGPVSEQISTLTQLLNQLIQESSERNSPTADTSTQQRQAKRSPSHIFGTSRALPAREFRNTGSPPDNLAIRRLLKSREGSTPTG